MAGHCRGWPSAGDRADKAKTLLHWPIAGCKQSLLDAKARASCIKALPPSAECQSSRSAGPVLLINMISVSQSVLRAQIKCGKCKYCTQTHRLTRLPRLSSRVSLSCSKQMSSEELEKKTELL